MILMEINKDLQDYGYKWFGMKEINLDDACKLFGKQNIYKLYEDNTESDSESTEDMLRHVADGGKLGIEKTKEETNEEISKLFLESDYDMLMYIKNLYKDSDLKLNVLINRALKSNEIALDTPIYYSDRNDLLDALGFMISEDGDNLIYVGDNKLSEDSYYYVVFALGRDLISGILPYYTDDAYNFCKEVANDFMKSEYNVGTKGLYTCLEEYVKDNFYLKNGKLTWKGKVIEND